MTINNDEQWQLIKNIYRIQSMNQFNYIVILQTLIKLTI